MNPVIHSRSALTQARLTGALPSLVSEGATLTEDIQWMPPGEAKITPFVDGQAKTITIKVDERVADVVAREVEAMRTEATARKGDFPYLDFNHEDGEASAEVLSLYWAGSDPVTGGIRARVKWTQAGRAALEGRSYRRFSPQWLANPETGDVVGVSENLGGLVNRAAFRTIQPVIAKRGGQTKDTEMTIEELNAAIAAGLKPVTDRLTALEAKATAADTNPTATAAASIALAALESRVKAVEAASGQSTLAQAKAAVAVHARRGAIPPQNAEVLAFWEAQHQANPAQAEKMLAAMPDNPVLGATFTAGAAGTVTPVADTAEGFVATFRAKLASGLKRSEALTASVAANSKGYAAWRDADGKLPL
jgi:hypothetical protein